MEFIFTGPDMNDCLSIIAQKLSRDSLANSFMLKLCVNKEGSVHISYKIFDHSYRDKQPVSIINLISKNFLSYFWKVFHKTCWILCSSKLNFFYRVYHFLSNFDKMQSSHFITPTIITSRDIMQTATNHSARIYLNHRMEPGSDWLKLEHARLLNAAFVGAYT